MLDASAKLARTITWGSSKQSYITARLLADPDLVDDCLRAYAYFRWADDMVDIASQTLEERMAFIARQKSLMDRLYRHEAVSDLSPEERMLSDLIAHDRGPNTGLRSFIYNFMAVIEFDAYRRDHPVSQRQLGSYTRCLGTAVMDGLLYFIHNGHPYPRTPERNLAVIGAHLTHMLRDTLEDLPAGFINVPAEEIEARHIDVNDPGSEAFQGWVQSQVEQAEACFQAGQRYIDSLDVLRAKLAGVWYCARFACILKAIKRDGYVLRQDYPERKCLKTWLQMAFLALNVIVRHHVQQIQRVFLPMPSPASTEGEGKRIPGESG